MKKGTVFRAMRVGFVGFGLTAAGVSAADSVLMSSEWGFSACEAWNQEATLTNELYESGWVQNDEGRGHKTLHLYRTDCGETPTVELRIASEEGAARCIYGGGVETTDLDLGVDYIMHATTDRWQEMGAGEYGPMKAMMFGRLKFRGPKWEAMKNMGPFEAFLQLGGRIPSEVTACP